MADTRNESTPFADKTGNDLTDDELLRGLWWGDPEFGPAVNALHREYVERRRAWLDYKCEVATALRHLRRVSFDAG